MDFNFTGAEDYKISDVEDIETFVNKFPDFQTVTLNDETELELLLELMGVNSFEKLDLGDNDFSKLWDISKFKLPEFDKKDFDKFYSEWLTSSKRSNNMDEYGNLIFLQGLSKKWNKQKHRLIVLAKE